MKKSLLVGAVAVCLGASLYAAEFINVLTGGTSGIYYPLGVALSQMYAKAIDRKVKCFSLIFVDLHFTTSFMVLLFYHFELEKALWNNCSEFIWKRFKIFQYVIC